MLKKLQATPKVVRYCVAGIAATLTDYIVYLVLALTIFGTDFLWLATAVSGVVSTCAAFWLHSHLTWIDRNPGKRGAVMFFAWSIIVAMILRSAVIALLSQLTGLYQFLFSITQWLGLPVSYDSVLSTGAYVIVTAMVMISSYLFYDRLVFRTKKSEKKSAKKLAKTASAKTAAGAKTRKTK